MKHDDDMFEEYDDDNLDHISQGPDYGNPTGLLKWSSAKKYLNNHPFTSTKYKIYNILIINDRTY